MEIIKDTFTARHEGEEREYKTIRKIIKESRNFIDLERTLENISLSFLSYSYISKPCVKRQNREGIGDGIPVFEIKERWGRKDDKRLQEL